MTSSAVFRCGCAPHLQASRSQREAASLELQQVQEDIGKQIVQLGTQVDRHGDDFSSTIKVGRSGGHTHIHTHVQCHSPTAEREGADQ